MPVQGISVYLIIAAWVMLLPLMLLCAGRLTARAKINPRGGLARLTVEWLCFCYTIYLRVNLLRPPYMTVQTIKKNGAPRKITKGEGKETHHETPTLPAPEILDVQLIVGVKDDPARCALLCGWARESVLAALRAYLPAEWAEALRVGCDPTDCADVFFVRATGMITLTPVQIISIAIQMRKRGA